ncbi:MAG: VWA domain-containing protein [Lachnospiraceae bacterium]|nr:VWA domain-containing protein [Lachnospiraceae bacterium]
MPEILRRPGGELASRPLHVIWAVDCSGSMYGEKIGTVNYAIQSVIPEMQRVAAENPHARMLVRTLQFSNGASWVTSDAIPVESFAWDDLKAKGLTDMGKAFELLSEQLTIPPMSDRALPPVLVLLSDGQPTDDYKKSLNKLLSLPWGKKAVRIAISIGKDANDDVLMEFTGNRELVLQANNAVTLVDMIKWASTEVPKAVAAPPSQPRDDRDIPSAAGRTGAGISQSTAASGSAGAGQNAAGNAGTGSGQTSGTGGPNADSGQTLGTGSSQSANAGGGQIPPKYIDMNKIPHPADIKVGDVW